MFMLISLHKNNKDICKTWWRRSQKFSWILNKLNESLHCYNKILTYFRNWVSIHFLFFLSTKTTLYCVIPENIHTLPLPPPQRMVLPIRPPYPPRNFCSRGVMYNTPPPPHTHTNPRTTPLGFPIFLSMALNLPYLEIIDRVPLKINCSHLKTQFFIIFDLFVIFYKAICIS